MSSPMTLRNFGGIHQLVVQSADDLGKIDALDPARWAATSAPLRDLHCDEAFLGFLDADQNGRIRVARVLAARDWLFARLADRSGVTAKSDVLTLAQLDVANAEGEKLRHAALHVMRELALGERTSLKLDEVRAFRAGYAKTLRNGDGIVPPELIEDAEVAAFARDLMSVVGSLPDASGFLGVGVAGLDRYLEGGRAFLSWKRKGATASELLPLGDATASAWAEVRGLAAKIDEQFLRCELLAQERLGTGALKLTDDELRTLRAKDLAGISAYLAAAPLAEPEPSCKLLIGGAVNPAFQSAWDSLSRNVFARILPGVTQLDRAGWARVQSTFSAHAAWVAERPPEPFEKVSDAQLAAQLDGPLPAKLRALIAIDAEAAGELANIAALEKAILFQRWLIELANNFVNFSSIYDPGQTALIEMGSLIVDGRRLEFCLKVESAARAAHKSVAAGSLAFLVYAQISESEGKPPAFEIVAPVTSGERGRLRVGKRGIFIDTAGKEWDAVVVEIVENPISLKEAAMAPMRRVQKFIGDKIESFAQSQLSSSEKAAHGATGGAIEQTGNVAVGATPPPAAPKPADSGAGMQTLVIGGSLAFAAVGSTLAYIGSIAPAKLVGVVIFLAGMSAFLGWLKLRRRDMGMLLEASGWAINADMKITRRLGSAFTRTPAFPPGTKVDRFDMLADSPEAKAQSRRVRRVLTLFVLALLAGAFATHYWYWNLRGH